MKTAIVLAPYGSYLALPVELLSHLLLVKEEGYGSERRYTALDAVVDAAIIDSALIIPAQTPAPEAPEPEVTAAPVVQPEAPPNEFL